MNDQNLIIYQFPTLYQILKELDLDLNLNIIEATNEEFLNNKVKDLKNYLVISEKKISHIDHQLIFNFSPLIQTCSVGVRFNVFHPNTIVLFPIVLVIFCPASYIGSK